MSNNTPSIRALQAIGITTTAFLSGGMTTISLMAIPALLSSSTPPSSALRQWTSMYALGRITTPPSLSFCTLIFLYLSWEHYPSSPFSKQPPEWQLYLTAAGMVGSALAFTYAVLERTNHEMLALDKEVKFKEKREEREEKIGLLLGRWKVLNLVRGVCLGVGAVVAGYAVLG